MKVRRPKSRTAPTPRPRRWLVEPLESRLLLSGIADAFGVKKVKYTEADGDKVSIQLKKDVFDVTFDRNLAGDITSVDTLTLYGNNPAAILSFKVKPAKGGLSDGKAIVDAILSAGPNVSLGGLVTEGAVIGNINLTGTLLGGFTTRTDFGSATFGHLSSFTIQGGHDLLGTLTVSSLGKFIARGGDIIGNLVVLTSLGEVQARNVSGTITVGTTFDKLTLSGDLSGDISFTKGTLEVLISGNVTPTGSIVGNDPVGTANIAAGGLTRLGVVGNFAGLFSADGIIELGVGGALSSNVVAGGNLTVKANTISANLTSTTGDVTFAMNTGGFAGVVNAADDVFGNGANGGIVIRGGNFTGAIHAGDEIAPVSFLPTSGGFNGVLTAGGRVQDITTNFFGSATAITAPEIGNLTALRSNPGDAIAAGATFTATSGSIGAINARAIGSIAIGGTFVAAENIGDITATSLGNAAADHAISGATFVATGGTIGNVTASAKGGSGINDSVFTAQTGMGDVIASSVSGHGFRASAPGLNLFSVLAGSFGSLKGTSQAGNGFHGGTFTASENIGSISGTSVTANGIGDGSGAVTTRFTALTGLIESISGTTTGGFAGSGGDGIVNTEVRAGTNADGVGIGAIEGSSQFGTGIRGMLVSSEGNIRVISGTTNNSNPAIDKDGIADSVFRTPNNIGNIIGKTAVAGGAGIGSAIENSIFSAGGSISPAASCLRVTSPGPLQVTPTQSVNDIIQALFGGTIPSGITIEDVQVVAPLGRPDDVSTSSIGLYKGFPTLPVGTLSQLPDGVLLTSGSALNALGPNDSSATTANNDAPGDADLDTLNLGAATRDAASITITFTSDASVKSLNTLFVFASEEFPEFVNSLFNDVFAVFLDGQNISNDPNGKILNVNNNFFLLNNTAQNPPLDNNDRPIVGTTQVSLADIQYDGLTPVLQVSTPGVLTPGTHTLKLAIADVGDNILDSGVFIAQICTSSLPGGVGTNLPSIAITATGDIRNSHFLAGYDIADFSLDGTAGDPAETFASNPVVIQGIQVTGDWVNSVAAAGIRTTDNLFGNGDDALAAPGSAIGNITVSSNIAGVVGDPARFYFQSDTLGNISANAIGVDPNTLSFPSAVGFRTDFSNGLIGSIGAIAATTTTQRFAIGDGTVFDAGSSIHSVTAINSNTNLISLLAIGQATFEAGTWIGDITALKEFSRLGAAIGGATFVAHDNNAETGLAIGNIIARAGSRPIPFPEVIATNSATFDASNPNIPGRALNIGTVNAYGDIAGTQFVATGDIARGVRFVSPTQVLSRDLNGDGALDLVLVNRDSDRLAVCLGDGNGAFGTPVFYVTGDAPVRAVIADVDGDGALDVVVLNSVADAAQEDSITVLLGNGDGTFRSGGTLGIGTQGNPTDIAVGDWIGDGNPDLAITDSVSGRVTILRGNGDGTFTEAAISDLPAGLAPSAVAVTGATGTAFPPPISFNGDGYIDMAVANFDSDTVSIFLGNLGQSGPGTGTWSAPTHFAVGDGPASVAIGSLNPAVDNTLDLVTANQYSNNVSVLLGTGTGSFGAATHFAVGTNPVAVALADLNNDGRLDILTANAGSNDISVLLGDGLGGFSAATQFGVGFRPVSLVAGDFNGDGNRDVAVANRDSGALTVLFGDGTGALRLRDIFTSSEIVGIRVERNLNFSTFIADSDGNGSGSLAAIGGIHTIISPAIKIPPIFDGQILTSTFSAGSNDPTTGVAIGNILVEGEDTSDELGNVIAHAINVATFTATNAPHLNFGTITTTRGSIGGIGGPGSTFTATGHVGDISAAASIAAQAAFTADSDSDGLGDVASVRAGAIEGAVFRGNNVALSDALATRSMTISGGVSDLTVTATTGSIGNLFVSQGAGDNEGAGASGLTFRAAVNIGDIHIAFTDPAAGGNVLGDSSFVAGLVDPTGGIGDIQLNNRVSSNVSAVLQNTSFVGGTGGIGDVEVRTSSSGPGIVDSSFRTTGTPDAAHRGDIGNITVVVGQTTTDAIFNSVISAIGSIGRGTGNASGLNIDIAGTVRGSRILAGYDIGADLTLSTGDDLFAGAIAHINSISVTGRFIASDLVVGVDPVNGQYGDSDDVATVIGSSLGSVALGGSGEPGQGGFIAQSPLADRFHLIGADLMGSVKVAGTERLADLPGYVDNGGGANDVNIKVL